MLLLFIYGATYLLRSYYTKHEFSSIYDPSGDDQISSSLIGCGSIPSRIHEAVRGRSLFSLYTFQICQDFYLQPPSTLVLLARRDENTRRRCNPGRISSLEARHRRDHRASWLCQNTLKVFTLCLNSF